MVLSGADQCVCLVYVYSLLLVLQVLQHLVLLQHLLLVQLAHQHLELQMHLG